MPTFKTNIMKTFILLLLMLVSISMTYFTYNYNVIALWITMGIAFISIVSFILITKKEDKKQKEYHNRSIYYTNEK